MSSIKTVQTRSDATFSGVWSGLHCFPRPIYPNSWSRYDPWFVNNNNVCKYTVVKYYNWCRPAVAHTGVKLHLFKNKEKKNHTQRASSYEAVTKPVTVTDHWVILGFLCSISLSVAEVWSHAHGMLIFYIHKKWYSEYLMWKKVTGNVIL